MIGGDLLSVSNFQLNYLMTDSFSLHSFVDLGNVFLRGRGVEFEDLRKGTGLGIDYLSPVGQIGFDLGFPIDRERGESTYRIYFTVGTLF